MSDLTYQPGVSGLFGVGISGARLAPEEIEILESRPPWAVILFRRNIEDVGQLRELTERVKALPGSPRLCVDQEGGPVDRFRDLLGPSVSFRAAAGMGLAGRAGELAGEACERLGFDVDLAPVVDRLLPGASERVLSDRCAPGGPDEVSAAANAFLAGLHRTGIGGCVKHFPGLGRASLDTHRQLPIVSFDAREQEADLAPFASTMGSAGAVMISHAAGPDGIPASLSPARATGLLRGTLGFAGAAFSDDLEMGALSAFGDLPRRCAAAMDAGCDLLFVCSRIGDYAACVEEVSRRVRAARLEEAKERLAGYARQLDSIRSSSRPAERPVSDLRAEIAALRDLAARPGPASVQNGTSSS